MSNLRIILCYDENEYLPYFTSLGHNLKEKNLLSVCCEKIVNMDDFKTLHCFGSHKKKDVNAILTYNNNQFIRGFFYIDNREYSVIDFRMYNSLQIENFCYDNLGAIQLGPEFGDGNHI